MRTVSVVTVERPDEARDVWPHLDWELPFLRITPTGVTDAPYGQAGAIRRTYQYAVRFDAAPPPGTFVGALKVVDPWDAERVETLDIHGRLPAEFQVSPARIEMAPDGRAELIVVTADSAEGLVVEPEAGPGSPWVVDRLQPSPNGRMHSFVIRVRDGQVAPVGDHRLVVRLPSRSAAAPVVVTVSVVRKERDDAR